MNEVEKILNRIGYDGYLVKDARYVVYGPRAIQGYVRPDRLEVYLHVLRHDQRFYEGIFHFLHPDVGWPKTEFRSYTGRNTDLDRRSVQQVINTRTGKYYADVDQYNYQDLVNMTAHLVTEVFKFGRKRA